MYLTQKNQIRNLNKAEFLALRELCRLSKNLYNAGLYTVRQYFFQERKHLRYEGVYHTSKENENYRLLSTDIAQQILKVVDRTFHSFYRRNGSKAPSSVDGFLFILRLLISSLETSDLDLPVDSQ